MYKRIKTVWTQNGLPVYAAGDGIYDNKRGYWKESTPTITYTECIRGNDINDIYAVGDFGMFLHYNGVSWQSWCVYMESPEFAGWRPQKAGPE